MGEGLDNLNLFFYTCLFGAMTQVVIVIGYQWLATSDSDSIVAIKPIDLVGLMNLETWKVVELCLNLLSFWGYMQFSFIVLSQVDVVTHSVANALRRPTIIAASVIYFGNSISVCEVNTPLLVADSTS